MEDDIIRQQFTFPIDQSGNSLLYEVITSHSNSSLPESLPSLQFVFLHGLSCNKDYFHDASNLLLNSLKLNFNVSIALIDLRGHGSSNCRAMKLSDFTLMHLSTDIKNILNSQALSTWKDIILIGHSFGGNLLLFLLSLLDMKRVRAVIFVDGGFIDLQESFSSFSDCRDALEPPKVIEYNYDYYISIIRDQWCANWPENGKKAVVNNFCRHSHSSSSHESSNQTSGMNGISLRLTFDRHVALLWDLYQHSPHSLITNLDVSNLSALFLGVSDDNSIKGCPFSKDKKRDIFSVLRRFPKASFRWIENVDHNFPVSNPELFVRMIILYLETIL